MSIRRVATLTGLIAMAVIIIVVVALAAFRPHTLMVNYDKDHAYEPSGVNSVYRWVLLEAEATDGTCTVHPGTTHGYTYAGDADLINLALVIPWGTSNCQFGVEPLSSDEGAPLLGTSQYEVVANAWRRGLQGRAIESLNVSLPSGRYVVTMDGEHTEYFLVVD